MASQDQVETRQRSLSLRWKTLIVLSLVLVLVNTSLALLSYQQLAGQFENAQAEVRDRQVRQLQALIEDRFRQMSRLANAVPLLAPIRPGQDLAGHLAEALDTNGSMLDLEWDIRSVHWLSPAETSHLLWPAEAAPLPAFLMPLIEQSADQTAALLTCGDDCRQYLAAPILWQGADAGTLVLGRYVADALLTFRSLTDAEVALLPQAETEAGTAPTFPAMTHPERTRPILAALGSNFWRDSDTDAATLEQDGETYDVFLHRDLAPGIDAVLVNRITRQRQAIAAATRDTVLIAILGLVLSEGLLLLVMQTPLARLRRIAHLLPLLADARFAELRQGLPIRKDRLAVRDEMDLMIDTVGTLSQRMEGMERDRAEAQRELVWLAEHDPLTRLCNRRRFLLDLATAVDRARRGSYNGALMFFDLDQFKDVNDISGHHMGDQLLQRVADQLAAIVPDGGVLSRLGGDEFGLILPRADADEALTLAAYLQNQVRSVVIHTRHWRHQVSASIGIVLFPEHGSESHQLMADADLAMYQAKEKGRGRWHLFSSEDEGRERANARVIWSERIAGALRDERFELHFQPLMEIASGKVWRAEALLRMRDPQGELVMPDSFIPIAEENGQIEAIDHWVLANAIALMQKYPEISLSVNLSANALQDPSLPPDVKRMLKRYAVDPKRLTFEITETIAINRLSNAIHLMGEIQQLGCRFALDDFGSGYASYAYLRQLPVNDVKIDGAFIRDIAHSQEDQIFVRAVTDMAHGMGKRVVAEFVENEEIVDVLRELGVDFAQGYFIGRPFLYTGGGLARWGKPPGKSRTQPEPSSTDTPTPG